MVAPPRQPTSAPADVPGSRVQPATGHAHAVPVAAKPAAVRGSHPSGLSPLLHDEVPDIARRIALETAQAPGLPLAILSAVGLFLLVQHRIDRKDPKLTQLAVTQDAELTFGPPAAGRPPVDD